MKIHTDGRSTCGIQNIGRGEEETNSATNRLQEKLQSSPHADEVVVGLEEL